MRLKEDPVKDKRIVELNDIVEEVKESEEWEAVKMNILEIGIEKGMQQGAEKKMLELVEKKLKKGEEIELKINFNGFAEINNKK